MEMRENAGTSKNKILIFGGTGYIGRHLVRASVSMGHPTYVYSRPVTPRTPSATVDIRSKFISVGVTVIQGELEEHEKMVSAMKHVDIVISALALPQVPDQLKIINAIIAAKNIRRFLPSEFGCEEDRIIPLQPFQSVLDKKRQIRRAIEASRIPFTFVSANCCSSYFINVLLHPHDNCSDKIIVYGTGEAKAVLNYEEDIAKYTIKVANDSRACNRIVIYRPPANVISQNELISLWEKKTGRSYEKVHMPEEDIVRLSQTLPNPQNIPISIIHSVFVKGDLMTYELKEDDLEVSSLYPEVDYVTIDKLLDIFLTDPPQPATAAFG